MRSSPHRRPAAPLGALAAALCSALAAAPAQAQGSAAVTVNATVGTPVVISADAPLEFTSVFVGTPKTVSPTTGGALGATAGRFSLQGRNNAQVLLIFTTPLALRSGVNLLPVDSWRGCLNETNTVTGCTPFVPSAIGTVTRMANGGGPGPKPLYIWVGATARPTATQPGGMYSAPLTLTAVYTGF